jgi:hypothetical protein
MIRYFSGYVDKNTKEYEEKRNRLWIDERKHIPVIPNSNGENFF